MALPALVLTLLAIIFVYRETLVAMVAIWELPSAYFAHSFLVPAITLWLAWRLRGQLAGLAPHPDFRVLTLFALAGVAWLLSELATVAIVSQFAFVSMLILAVPAILGLEVVRRIIFPLAFLYFAVPFGEFAIPQLMDWTADATVLGLRLTGIPVYREGMQFVIPSGSWSVIESCGGLRYFVATSMIGTLFSYLTFQSYTRRIIFIGVSCVVAVVANWLRAYMVVMLAHLSGNKLATGVDHLYYGWALFGVVIMSLFWIGSRWREDKPHAAPSMTGASETTAARSSFVRAAAAVVALALVAPLAIWQIEHNLPPQIERIEPLEPIAGWAPADQALTDWKPSFDNYSAAEQSAFEADGRKVGLFVAYYRNQDAHRKLVTSTNVLVPSNDPRWARVAAGTREAAIGPQQVPVRTAELRSADSTRLVVWQWYWIAGHLTASDYKAKIYTVLARLAGQGDDSAVVIVHADKEREGPAALEAFVWAAGPSIEQALQRTRDRR